MTLVVGVDARPLLEPPGGLRRYLVELLPALAGAAPDLRLRLYSTRAALPLAPAAAQLVHLPGAQRSLLRLPWEEWTLPRALRAAPPDVFLATYGAVPRGRACPSVAVVHDLSYRREPAWLRPQHRWYWRAVAARLPRATAFLAASAATRADCLALGLPAERVHVHAWGVAAAFQWRAQDGDVRARFDLPAAYVVAVGRWDDRRKNLALLARAAAAAEITLAIVGPRPSRAPGGVRLLGVLADHELAALLRAATAFAMPSLDEGFGLPLAEALACGAPALAARAGALPEVAGDAALLLEAHDEAAWTSALRRVRGDDALRAELRARALRRAQAFSWPRLARQVLALLRRAAARA